MLSKKFEPLRLELAFPRRLAAWFLFLVLTGASAIFLSGLPLATKVVVLILLVVGLRREWQRLAGAGSPHRVSALHRDGEGRWRLRLADGSEQVGRLRGDSVAWTSLAVVRVAVPGKRVHSVVITPERVSRDQWRRLQVALRRARGA